MAELDLRYIPISYMQEYFVDKGTGDPLAAGVVTFYEDNNRTTLKPIYKLTGTPGNYTYTPIPNPNTLSSIGTIQDGSGNDVVAYFFPYDAAGNIDLYYVKIENSGAVSQFTREGQPNTATASDKESDLVNFVSNGQFLLHNNLFETGSNEEFEITSDNTIIAPGNWIYRRSPASTAKDYVEFARIGSAVITPASNPRYELHAYSILANPSDTYKGIRLRFPDVNKFSDSSGTVEFTFSFSMQNDVAIPIRLIKNFGTGGDPEEPTLFATIPISGQYEHRNVKVTFTSNVGKIIGDNNDDYIELDFQVPTATTYDIKLDNVGLIEGDKTLSTIPDTSNGQFLYRALAGSIPTPDPDGMDIGLPIRMGLNGFEFDDTEIGLIKGAATFPLSPYLLGCRGEYYRTRDRNAITGIPYRRLYEKWLAPAFYGFEPGMSIHGQTGEYLISGTIAVAEFSLEIHSGTITAPVDGTPATGFTFTSISATEYKVTVTKTGATLTAGANFIFEDRLNRKYVLWYTVDGVGSKPVVGGTHDYIPVAIVATDTADDISKKTQTAINAEYLFLPDIRGYFLRGWADGSSIDPDRATRSGWFGTTGGDKVGTFQASEYMAHDHPNSAITTTTIKGSDQDGDVLTPIGSIFGEDDTGKPYYTGTTGEGLMRSDVASSTTTVTIDDSGGLETRSVNNAVYWATRY